MDRNRSIVYAEDDELVRETIAFALTRVGFVVHACGNGEDAVRLCLDHRPDFTLLDIDMPILDGCAALQCLRAHPELKSTRIVALTGRDRVLERARTCDFDALLVKPIEFSVLLDALETPSAAAIETR